MEQAGYPAAAAVGLIIGRRQAVSPFRHIVAKCVAIAHPPAAHTSRRIVLLTRVGTSFPSVTNTMPKPRNWKSWMVRCLCLQTCPKHVARNRLVQGGRFGVAPPRTVCGRRSGVSVIPTHCRAEVTFWLMQVFWDVVIGNCLSLNRSISLRVSWGNW